jgi:hypothetical protein
MSSTALPRVALRTAEWEVSKSREERRWEDEEARGRTAERERKERNGNERTTTESLSNSKRDLFGTVSQKLGERDDGDEGKAMEESRKVSEKMEEKGKDGQTHTKMIVSSWLVQ